MTDNALELFIQRTRSSWGPLTSDLVASSRRHLEELVKAPATESWLSALREEAPASKELYRDEKHGFVLQAHTERAGLYRPPHDHGRGWVIYALQGGEIAMSTYARVETADGIRLVKRDETLLRAGQAQLFLPGDIHDTRCVTGPALLFRFTERDLKQEDLVARRVTRYVERNGIWTVAP
jgi:predicted metal-dependent enzyme (double-stranded beta helix superfamily)